jgi:hypothetical protein
MDKITIKKVKGLMYSIITLVMDRVELGRRLDG